MKLPMIFDKPYGQRADDKLGLELIIHSYWVHLIHRRVYSYIATQPNCCAVNVMVLRNWTEWWSYLARSNCDSFNDDDNNNNTRHVNDENPLYLDGGGASSTTLDVAHSNRVLLLDIRPYHEYQERNLVSVTNDCNNFKNIKVDCEPLQIVYVHIPFDEVVHRKFELPPRQVPFAIVSSFPEEDWSLHWENIQAMLSSSGSSNIKKSTTAKKGAATITSLDQNQSHHPSWNVMALLNANDETMWESAAAHIGDCNQNDIVPNQNKSCTSLPLPRLWSPDPMIEHVLFPLLKEKLRSIRHRQEVMEIWDVGSGLGRDVCYLAEELMYSDNLSSSSSLQQGRSESQGHESLFRIIGYDQRYRHLDSTSDTMEFWNRRRVSNVTECYCCDLNHIQTDLESLLLRSNQGRCINGETTSTRETKKKTSFIGCIYAVRYWNKAFFQMLVDAGCRNADDDNNNDYGAWVLETGTLIAISHFGKSSVDAKWDFPHPKEQHVLERDELLIMFTTPPTAKNKSMQLQELLDTNVTYEASPQRSWKILHDEVVSDSDYGRTLIQFVAQLV